mmetsp:Transcript_5477/g.13692  ORF Transcript_5477/g.13692 Transcript_5477/m.13692 type:complete len:460 (-) Transcript_5477:116-1495(-)
MAAPLIEPEWQYAPTTVNVDDFKEHFPDIAYTAKAAQLFNMRYGFQLCGIADYCGPAHRLARFGTLLLYCGLLFEFFWPYWLYSKTDCSEPPNDVLAKLVAGCICCVNVLLEWRCLQFVFLPWQDKAKGFKLMLGIGANYYTWILFHIGLTLVSEASVLANAHLAGSTLGWVKCTDTSSANWLLFGFILTMVLPVNTTLYQYPAPWEYDVEDDAPENCCHHQIGKWGTVQSMSFKFGRNIEPNGKPKQFAELRFARWAQWFGIDDWESTHYEALLEWGRTSFMGAISNLTLSFQRAEMLEFQNMFVKDGVVHAAEANFVMQYLRRAQFVCRKGFLFMLAVGVLKSAVQLVVQVMNFKHLALSGNFSYQRLATIGVAFMSAMGSELGLFLDVFKYGREATEDLKIREAVDIMLQTERAKDYDDVYASTKRWFMRFCIMSAIAFFFWGVAAVTLVWILFTT